MIDSETEFDAYLHTTLNMNGGDIIERKYKMTKWYSPKDKLPKYSGVIKDESILVWGFYIIEEKPYYNRTAYHYNEKLWEDVDEYCFDAPVYWCYLPEIPQELIDKLKEENNG